MPLPQTPVWTDEAILAFLVLCNGACLIWQVPDVDAFASAEARSIINYGDLSDCYIHPNAIELEEGGFEMPPGHHPSQTTFNLVLNP